MKIKSESISLDNIIKEHYYKPFNEIKQIVKDNDLAISEIRLKRLIAIQVEKNNKGSGIYFNGHEWTDTTPTNHRLTKTYRQLIKNEFSDGEVVGKKVN
jgi:hypothetical protein